MNLTYKDSGVDIEAGENLVDWLRQSSKTSKKLKDRQKNLVEGIGGFASLFKAKFPGMKSPALVSCTDGVGTKVLIASEFNEFRGVGQDLVAMCVNDLICTGGEPLFFLDYYACGKLNLDSAKEFLTGVRNACDASGCLLMGGETAEMPGVYSDNHFDCAGFSVGVVDEKKRLGPDNVKAGDCIIGVSSSGFHSNGYSLLRRVFADDLEKHKDLLLTPTALYVELAAVLRKKVKSLRAMAHITGGGMDNISRVLPEKTKAVLRPWKMPEPFHEVKRRAGLEWNDLLTTLNCGMGLALIVSPKDADRAMNIIEGFGFESFDLGEVQNSSEKKPSWEGLENGLS